ncbi:multicopper oxidase domain-containing protein [Microbacterium trichothecenolyticum]
MTSRRGLLVGAATAALPAPALLGGAGAAWGHTRPAGGDGGSTMAGEGDAHSGHGGHAGFPSGSVPPSRVGFDPTQILRDFDRGRTSTLADGRTLREWDVMATEREIEIAPGVLFPAWTYNGRIPGPTFWAREGDLMRVHFTNATGHPHTIHFHGVHTAEMDGMPGVGRGNIMPGESFTYEFTAEPFGTHLYHCHTPPLAVHISKGLYGAFVVEPKAGRAAADDELVMVMNGYNSNGGDDNEFYSVNGLPFHFMDHPVQVKKGALVRIHLINILEFDPINSFHIHANFFDWYPTGTRLTPSEYTDTVMLAQGQRGMLELRFPYEGKYMFHAHKTEFSELGWVGFFEVTA